MYEITQNKLGLFSFRLRNEKGEVLIVSDSYTQKTNCQKGISSIQRNGKNTDNYKTDKMGFGIKAGNGQFPAYNNNLSEKNENEVQNIIKEVISLCTTKQIRDLTKGNK